MPILEWSSSFDIGCHKMNEEHKVILTKMNELFDKNAAGAPKPALSQIIKDLASVTVKHFADEEAYMESIQFPDLGVHKFVHKDLLTKFTTYAQGFEAGTGKVDPAFFNFLKIWLSAHIQGVDKKYGDFAKSVGKAA